jgi:hypothetical protein
MDLVTDPAVRKLMHTIVSNVLTHPDELSKYGRINLAGKAGAKLTAQPGSVEALTALGFAASEDGHLVLAPENVDAAALTSAQVRAHAARLAPRSSEKNITPHLHFCRVRPGPARAGGRGRGRARARLDGHGRGRPAALAQATGAPSEGARGETRARRGQGATRGDGQADQDGQDGPREGRELDDDERGDEGWQGRRHLPR